MLLEGQYSGGCNERTGAGGWLAIIEIEPNGQTRVQWRDVEEDRLSLYGIGYAKAEKFRAAGIVKVQQIVDLTPVQLAHRLKCSLQTANSYHIRAKSVVENRIIGLKPLMTLNENPIFLDIETDLAQRVVWLIGVYFSQQDRFVQYFADTPGHERRMLKEFLTDMKEVQGTMYTYSGTRFDERVLKRRIEANVLGSSKLNSSRKAFNLSSGKLRKSISPFLTLSRVLIAFLNRSMLITNP